jgi:polyisoprenoid-binding protein YceI
LGSDFRDHLNRFGLLVFFFLWIGFPAFSQSEAPHSISSDVQFEITNAKIVAKGHFEDIKTQIRFNPQQPEKTFFQTRIAISSIRTGIRLRDKHLQNPVYFHAELFPSLEVDLVRVEKFTETQFTGIFRIRIKGVEKEMSLPVQWKRVDNQYVFTSEFSVNRRDFKVGGKSWTLSDLARVEARFSIPIAK